MIGDRGDLARLCSVTMIGDGLRGARGDAMIIWDRERLRRTIGGEGEREVRRRRLGASLSDSTEEEVRRYALGASLSDSTDTFSASAAAFMSVWSSSIATKDVTELANEYVIPNLSISALVSGVEGKSS